MRASETGLRLTASDEAFADAMARCQNPSGECAYVGKCIYGDCFATDPENKAARMIMTLIPADGRGGQEYAYLRKCVELLKNGRVHL